MTVRENVMAAAYGHTSAGAFRSIFRTPGQRREEREIRALAEERLAFFGERLMGYRGTSPRTRSRTPTGAGSRSPARRRRSRGCSCSTSPPPG